MRAIKAVRMPQDGCQLSLSREGGVQPSRVQAQGEASARVEGRDGETDLLLRLEPARGGEHVHLSRGQRISSGPERGGGQKVAHLWRLERVLGRQDHLAVVDTA